MLLKRYTGEIVEGNRYVDEIIWYDDGSTPVPFLQMRRILRAGMFDAAVVVYPRVRLALLVAASGIPLRIGTGYRYYSFLFNRRVYEHRKDARRHEVDYNIGLLKMLGCESTEEPEFSIHIPDAVHESVRRRVAELGAERIVVLHPGSGGSAREWPPEHFGQLGKRLAEDGNLSVIVTGIPDEEKIVSRVLEEMEGKGIPMVGTLSVKELSALLAMSLLDGYAGDRTLSPADGDECHAMGAPDMPQTGVCTEKTD
jgi:ADP-heptose:LPS heptosyltransferase